MNYDKIVEELHRCREMGLSPATAHTLLAVLMDHPVNITVIADRIGVSRPAITGTLDALEAGGWIVRAHSYLDRRAVMVSPTEKAFAAFPDTA